MSDTIQLIKRMENLDISPEINGYSCVIIHIDESTYVQAGNPDEGRTLEIDNPFGTQELADELLQKLQGYRYNPYSATGALLDPTAEIGDAVTGWDLHGGIYTRDRTFSRLMKADISAPHDEEIDHEYKYESAFERRYKREYANTKAELSIQATKIEAKVEADTSENRQSFGWKLQSDSWEVFSNGQTVLKATSGGLEVSGKITATSGQIGGFTIGATAIYNGRDKIKSDTPATGVYLGTDGICISNSGGSYFRATSSGDIEANNMTAKNITANGILLKGSLKFYDTTSGKVVKTLSASDFISQVSHSYESTTAGGYCYGGASGGYNWNYTQNAGTTSRPNIFVGQVNARSLAQGGYGFVTSEKTINGTTIRYWSWSGD